ncbi:hypothetical protein AAMO2058_001091500 [Amorphochlora amoebiformis]
MCPYNSSGQRACLHTSIVALQARHVFMNAVLEGCVTSERTWGYVPLCHKFMEPMLPFVLAACICLYAAAEIDIEALGVASQPKHFLFPHHRPNVIDNTQIIALGTRGIGAMASVFSSAEDHEDHKDHCKDREVRSVVEWDMDAGCVDGPHEDGSRYILTTSQDCDFIHLQKFHQQLCQGEARVNVSLKPGVWYPVGTTRSGYSRFYCDPQRRKIRQEVLSESVSCEGDPALAIPWDGTGLCSLGPERDGTYYRTTCLDTGVNIVQYPKSKPKSRTCQSTPRFNTTIPFEQCMGSSDPKNPYSFQFSCTPDARNATESVWVPGPPPPSSPSEVHNVTMRDGAQLYTGVYYEKDMDPSSKLPVVYVQCPYDSRFGGCSWVVPMWQAWLNPPAKEIEAFKSVLVYQESRGTWRSDGGAFEDAILWQYASQDSKDTTEWIKKQPWCNGKIMLDGLSAGGVAAYLTSDNGESYSGMHVGIAGSSVREVLFRGGALSYETFTYIGNFVVGPADAKHPSPFHPNITKYNMMENYVKKHENPGGIWNSTSYNSSGHISWPVIQSAGWYDLFNSVSNFEHVTAASKWDVKSSHAMQIVPLGHCGETGGIPGQAGFTRDLAWNHTAIQTLWAISNGLAPEVFNLFGNNPRWAALVIWNLLLDGLIPTVPKIPRLMWYVLGSEPYPKANFIAVGDRLPSPQYRNLYLSSQAEAVFHDPAEGFDEFIYNPSFPMPTIGGHLFYNEQGAKCGPQDQTPALTGRSDYLLFESAPLKQPLYITGNVRGRISIETNVTDTDLVLKLIDCWEDKKMLVADGIVRMRWRGNVTSPNPPMEKGKTYQVDVDLWSISWRFASNHTIGIIVTSSNYPAVDVNPNNALPLSKEGPNVTASHRIVFAGESYVTLPIVQNTQLKELTFARFERQTTTYS